MKAFEVGRLITLLQQLSNNETDIVLKSNMDDIFEEYGDDWYINRDEGNWTKAKDGKNYDRNQILFEK